MSPNIEPVVAQADGYTLRLIGPKAAVWPTTPAAPVAVLARTDMVARPLPSSSLPSDPNFVSGSWSGRLGDAGDGTFVFPNATAADGVPWRQRFDSTGHLQFLEVKDNGVVDFCGVIDQVTVDQQKVTVHASDGWFLLKKAYERDWVVTQAPRDVIERGTQVWVPTTADNFPAGSLGPQWTDSSNNGGTATIASGGGLVLSAPSSGSPQAEIASGAITVPSTGTWRASVQEVNVSGLGATPGVANFLFLQIRESSGQNYTIYLNAGTATGPSGQMQVPAQPNYDLALESDGEWISAFVNGQLVGTTRRVDATTTSLTCSLGINGGNGTAATATLSGVLVETLTPFLQRGSDKGDYVLPGNATTYPPGGLHARYYNDLDLQSDVNRLSKILAPSRSQAYAGSGASEYANQQDPIINGQANPTPGAAQTNWSAKWFGAIYLPLSRGNFVLQIGAYQETAFRLWVGQTEFGTQLLDQWTFPAGSGFVFYNATVSAVTLAGALPYGGTVARDGWYPIKIEYAVNSTLHDAPGLYLKTVPGSGSYTDPGGTSIAAGTNGDGAIAVPSTSLSPLGCVDNRYQGVSHFDLVQQTAQAFAYQASVEPQPLESGLFPGVLAPRVREGHDTDIILQPDRGPRQDGEGLLNYSSSSDATDFAASLQGNGAGFQNGTSGQLQANVYDPPTLENSLFDVQGWQDSSDASFLSLLQALLNSQLGLRLSPWQLLSADPMGQARLAYTWPLPGALAAMRWRPGDGMRIQARDINVWDTAPRQMLVITRNILPNGKASTQANFANRPRTPARTLKQQLYAATRWQRNYQRQLVTIPGTYTQENNVAAGATTNGYSIASLQPGDTLVRARLRINVISTALATDVLVNGVDQTSTLNGPWSVGPVNLDVTGVAAPDSGNRMYVRLKNTGGSNQTQYDWQLLLDVLR